MKKIVLFFALVVCIYANGQEAVEKFEITPDGINGYVVKDFEGKSSKELYNAVKKWAEYNIFNASEAKHSDVENEFLAYEMYSEKKLHAKNAWVDIYWDIFLNLDIHFKDGKVRFDITQLRFPQTGAMNSGDFYLKGGGMIGWSFFSGKGKPRKVTKDTRENFNIFLNTIISDISNYIENPPKKDW